MKACIECGNERNIILKDGRLRTRCRLCWNRYSNEIRKKHLNYYAKYIRNYNSNRIKTDAEYREKVYAINNKSNKKAVQELKESYLKNRVMDGAAWNNEFKEFIEIKKSIIQIYRIWKAQSTTSKP